MKQQIGIMGYASQVLGGRVLVAESTGEDVRSEKLDDLMVFLLEDWDEPERNLHYIKVAWDLDEFCAPIFRLLPQEACGQLAGGKHKAWVRPFKLFYIRDKVFGITYGKHEVNIYGLRQYFGEKDKPRTAKEVCEYGERLLGYVRGLGMNPTKFASPVGMFEECVLRHMSVPTIFNMPDFDRTIGAAEYALQVADREWRSVYQIGHWDEAYDYDLRFAYASEVARLRDTRYCDYRKSDRWLEDADWGVVKGRITVEALVSPVVYYDGDRYYTPVGTWEGHFTTEEIEWLQRRKAGSFEMQDGWFLNFKSTAWPFECVVNRVFGWRQAGEVKERVATGIGHALWGKFLEEHDDGSYGSYFHPIYAAMVTSRVRLKVADFIHKYGLRDGLIAVTVDGVLAEKRVRLPKGVGMGQWRLNPLSLALVLSSGYQFYANKKPHGIGYERIMEAIREHPRRHYFGVPLMRRQTLVDSVAEGAEFKDMGKQVRYQASVDLLALEHDRVFEKLPKTGEQLLSYHYKSVPMEVRE